MKKKVGKIQENFIKSLLTSSKTDSKKETKGKQNQLMIQTNKDVESAQNAPSSVKNQTPMSTTLTVVL